MSIIKNIKNFFFFNNNSKNYIIKKNNIMNNYSIQKILSNNEFIGLPHEIIPNFIDWEIDDVCELWIDKIVYELIDQKNIKNSAQLLDNFFKEYASSPYPITFEWMSKNKSYIFFKYKGVNDLNELIFCAHYVTKFELSDVLFTIPLNFFKVIEILKNESKNSLLLFYNDSLNQRYEKIRKESIKQKHELKNVNIEEQLKNSEYNQFLIDYKKSLRELNH
jgi:hypothetical protein